MAKDIAQFIAENEQNIKRDIKRLIDIKSVKSAPEPGAPYGAGVRAAQLEAMKFCEELGLETVDCEGRIAYAHYGRQDKFIGVIAHMDVVPEGNGWDTPPYDCTERDGYLVGRGTSDDKGPFVIAAYAVKYLIENKIDLNYGVRLIIGLDEETGMSDIEYYKAHYPQPNFTFTPDADFPVGHGEKGIYSADLVSGPVGEGAVLLLEGGVASNVVADHAQALVRSAALDTLKKAAQGRSDIRLTEQENGVLVEAFGRAAHAGTPATGINANHILMKFLCESGVLEPQEQAAASFIAQLTESYDGRAFGIDAQDGLFAPNSIIGGVLKKEDGRFVLNVNSRYNTAIEPKEIEKRIENTANQAGFTVCNMENSGPFYMSPEHPAVQTMCEIYGEVTGADARPYVMSGGTYARHMDNAVSYGIECPQENVPEWVGTAHMKNEALGIEHAKQCCEIYIKTFLRLQQVDL